MDPGGGPAPDSARQLRQMALAVREARGVLRRVDRLSTVLGTMEDPDAEDALTALRDAAEHLVSVLGWRQQAEQRRLRTLTRRGR